MTEKVTCATCMGYGLVKQLIPATMAESTTGEQIEVAPSKEIYTACPICGGSGKVDKT